MSDVKEITEILGKEIVKLKAANAKLREALEKIKNAEKCTACSCGCHAFAGEVLALDEEGQGE